MKNILFSIGAAILLAGCTYFGGGGREEEAPTLRPLEPLATVETVWSSRNGSGTGRHWLILQPSVEDGRVFTADASGRVYAHDAASGEALWRTDTGADLTGGVGAGGGLVVAGSEDGEVFALGAETGEPRWHGRVSSEVLSAPRVVGDRVVVRALDGKLFGLDAASGAERWSYDGGVTSLSVRGTSPPAVVSDLVIAGFDNGRIVAIVSATGELVWEAAVATQRGTSELERLADIDAEPVVAGGVVYAASHERAIAAFEVANGRMVWRRTVESRSGLAVDSELLYVADTDGAIHALDRVSGETVWTESSLVGRGPAWPIIHGPFLAVTDVEGYVHWLRRADGKPAARTRSGGAALAGPPARHDDALIAYRSQGSLAALAVR